MQRPTSTPSPTSKRPQHFKFVWGRLPCMHTGAKLGDLSSLPCRPPLVCHRRHSRGRVPYGRACVHVESRRERALQVFPFGPTKCCGAQNVIYPPLSSPPVRPSSPLLSVRSTMASANSFPSPTQLLRQPTRPREAEMRETKRVEKYTMETLQTVLFPSSHLFCCAVFKVDDAMSATKWCASLIKATSCNCTLSYTISSTLPTH